MSRIRPAAFAALLLLPSISAAQAPPTVVRAGVATVKEVRPHHRVTGSLRAVARGDVAALEEGRITELTVREGATVSAGEVIARIDARRLEAQRSELAASLRAAEAQLEERKLESRQQDRDLARSKQLVDRRVISIEEHQHRETDAAVAAARLQTEETRLAEIESQIQLLDVRLEDTVVRAPYDGRVVVRHAEPGEWIKAGEPFVTLISSGKIEAWLDVPERYAQVIPPEEQAFQIELAGDDKTHTSISAKRIADLHPRTRTFPLVLTLDDAGGALSPGMSVNAWLPIGASQPRLTAPKNAVIRNGRTAYVYKAVEQDGAHVAVQTPVSVQFELGAAVVVESDGLANGDLVITEGNERLMPGAAIVVAGEPTGGDAEIASVNR